MAVLDHPEHSGPAGRVEFLVISEFLRPKRHGEFHPDQRAFAESHFELLHSPRFAGPVDGLKNMKNFAGAFFVHIRPVVETDQIGRRQSNETAESLIDEREPAGQIDFVIPVVNFVEDKKIGAIDHGSPRFDSTC
jgi:hypothetical protein